MSKENPRNKSKVSKSATKRNRTSSNTLRKRWVVYFSLIGLAGFIGFYILIGGQMVDGAGDTPLPDFKVYTTQGEYTFSEQKGKTLVYFFSFPGWPECTLEAPALARIQSEYRDRNLEVIAVNIYRGAPLDYWQRYWQAVGGGEVIYAQDRRREAMRALDIQTAGATVVISKQGRVVFRDRAATRYEVLKKAVEAAL